MRVEMLMLAGAMKAKYNNQTKNKSTRRNNAAALASSEWYQQFVRFVELRDIPPRTRVSYIAWVRRLHEARPGRDITALTEGEVLDFLVALRHEREFKDSTINQAASVATFTPHPWALLLWRKANGLRLHPHPPSSADPCPQVADSES